MSLRIPLRSLTRTQPRPTAGPLIDTFGRVHDNLRVSVTDRCNLRCTYCMPEHVEFRPAEELLSFDEITRFVRVAANLGVRKVRLTGGEPLLRRDLPSLVASLGSVPGIADVALTTNGLLLASQAQALVDAGLRRINVSLDTLDPVRFRQLARRDGLDAVLNGLAAARRVGLTIKLNAIALSDSAADVVPLAKYAREHGHELRFIEYMPIGDRDWRRDRVLTADMLIDLLSAEFGPLIPADDDPHAPATTWQYADGVGRVGIIASVSRPFCGQCNRLRLTADGKIRNCLFSHDETDIRPLLDDAESLEHALRQTIWDKGEGHEINAARFVQPERTMHAIGG